MCGHTHQVVQPRIERQFRVKVGSSDARACQIASRTVHTRRAVWAQVLPRSTPVNATTQRVSAPRHTGDTEWRQQRPARLRPPRMCYVLSAVGCIQYTRAAATLFVIAETGRDYQRQRDERHHTTPHHSSVFAHDIRTARAPHTFHNVGSDVGRCLVRKGVP